MKASPFHGMDHIGITVADMDAATRFFETAFDAETIYESKSASEAPDEGADLERTLGVPSGTKLHSVRMLALRWGPGIELFQFTAPDQKGADPARGLRSPALRRLR